MSASSRAALDRDLREERMKELAPEMFKALRAIELRVDGLNTRAFQQKPETQAALDAIKAMCRAQIAKVERS